MKNLSFLISIVLFFLGTVSAQDSKVTSGVILYEQGSYEESISKLDLALENPDLLKEKSIAKAYIYRAASRRALMAQLGQQQNTEALEKYQDGFLECYNDLMKAKEYELSSLLKREWENQMDQLKIYLLSSGFEYINFVQTYRTTQEDRDAYYYKSIEYFNAVLEIEDSYLAYDLKGQALLALNDSLNAYACWEKSIYFYFKDKPEKPDPTILYAYYRMAIVDRYHHNDMSKALYSIETGKSGSKIIREDINTKYTDKTFKTYKSLIKSLDYADADLQAFYLDILLNSPDKLDEAIKNFDMEIAGGSKDYNIYVAYANLLESTNIEKSIDLYKQAIALDSTRSTAYFNLGAIYFNDGAKYTGMSYNAESIEKENEYVKLATEYFEKAFPLLERSYELSPDLVTANSLLNIVLYLNLEDKINYYAAEKKKYQ